MGNMLTDIIAEKRIEVSKLKQSNSIDDIKDEALNIKGQTRDFKKSIRESKFSPGVIAEIKKKSPSKGTLRKEFEVTSIGKAYEKEGACAISVLTDERYFGGRLEYLRMVKECTTRCPILRKDFIIDEYQLYESLIAGADAVLLIAAVLTQDEITRFTGTANDLGLCVLFEVHLESEINMIPESNNIVVGINNRDLNTFDVSLSTTQKLLASIDQNHVIISESGIKTKDDLDQVRKWGVDGVLIGESFMVEDDPGKALQLLISNDKKD